MKKFLKWAALVVVVLLLGGFLAFLYFIPPFTSTPPEEFSRPEAEAPPSLDGIADPKERLLAERGRYIVTVSACAECHTTPGPQGPLFGDMYMAGGFKMSAKGHGTYVSANLTPDKDTGLARWSDDEVKRILRSGVAPDGRLISPLMPWSVWGNWTDEDLHAVVVYLRHLKPVPHRIPPPVPATLTDPMATEEDYGGADYGMKP